MRYRFKTSDANKAFSLVETIAALIILALISSGALLTMNRSMASAADSVQRCKALEVARENMEKLLASSSVQETAEYGTSTMYPEIKWQTVVETFYEPITARMWVRGVCSAEYEDTQGQTQTIELTHWLTNVTKQQLLQILKGKEEEEGIGQEELVDQIIETIEDAAEYAGVDVETIQQWLENGMLRTEDGSFIMDNLDLYEQNDGKPTSEQKSQQIKSVQELSELSEQRSELDEQNTTGEQAGSGEIDPTTGLTYEELEEMNIDEIFNLLRNMQQQKAGTR